MLGPDARVLFDRTAIPGGDITGDIQCRESLGPQFLLALRAYEEHLPYQLYAMHVNSKMARHDLEEGRDAFREKRKPQWQGLKKNKRKD